MDEAEKLTIQGGLKKAIHLNQWTDLGNFSWQGPLLLMDG